MMNRIDTAFKKLRAAKKKAFIAFVTAGYPDMASTERLVKAMAERGVDIVELGVPFSDPIADGPVIQEASQYALRKKVNLDAVLALVRRLRRVTDVPLCIMSYYNPVFAFGIPRFLKKAADAGLDGLIIPDLPLEEGLSLSRKSSRAGIATVFFVTPTTEAARMRTIARISSGFIYYISLTGVTGTRGVSSADIAAHIKQVRAASTKPVCVGFGISTPQQVRDISRIADGVIVGSAIVKEIRRHLGRRDLVPAVTRFVTRLSNART